MLIEATINQPCSLIDGIRCLSLAIIAGWIIIALWLFLLGKRYLQIKSIHTKTWILALLLIGFGKSLILEAADANTLYRVEWPVEDQSVATRQQAILFGFKEVLVRKSGSQNILQAYEVQQSFSKVTSFLQRFEYVSVDPRVSDRASPPSLPRDKPQVTTKPGSLSASGSASRSAPAFLIRLDFDPALIDNLIHAAGMPLWGNNRPISILWLAIEENGVRRLLSNEGEYAESEGLLRQQANRRGLQIVLPIMDLEDELQLQFSDVWGRFPQPLRSASLRYGADSILGGKISQLGEIWEAKLVYINRDEISELNVQETTKEQLFITLSNQLAELLCSRYCVVEVTNSENQPLQLYIDNINNFAQFKRVQNYLSALSAVRSSEVVAIKGSISILNLHLLGEVTSVSESIGLGNHLIALTDDEIERLTSRLMTKFNQGEVNSSFNANSVITPTNSLNSHLVDSPELLMENTKLIQGDELLDNKTANSGNRLYYRWVE